MVLNSQHPALGCSKLALQLFSEVFSDIFLSIGKTIKHYYDNYAREMTFEVSRKKGGRRMTFLSCLTILGDHFALFSRGL